jgi:hypothetical protein
MRVITLICCAVLLLAGSLGGQSEEDDYYSVRVVTDALKMRSGGQRIVHSWTQKYLARLGDRVSIALLKLLNEHDLENPETVKSFLPVIRDAFDQMESISVGEDKEPKVTLFLLSALDRKIGDPEAQQEIRQTIAFVKEKAGQRSSK